MNIGDIENRWNLKLNNDIPLDLFINAGASETNIDLRGPKFNESGDKCRGR